MRNRSRLTVHSSPKKRFSGSYGQRLTDNGKRILLGATRSRSKMPLLQGKVQKQGLCDHEK